MTKAEEFLKSTMFLQSTVFLPETTTAEICEAYHQSRVNAISDEMISNYIEYYIEKHGYKYSHIALNNEYLTHSQVENIIDWFKEQLKQ